MHGWIETRTQDWQDINKAQLLLFAEPRVANCLCECGHLMCEYYCFVLFEF